MAKKYFFICFAFVFLLTSNLLFSKAQANTYQSKNNCPVGYQFRENDARCEGVIRNNISSGPNLVSFSVGQLQSTNPLTLRVPKTSSNSQPAIEVYSRRNGYSMIPREPLRQRGNYFFFNWASTELEELGIFPSNLNTLNALTYLEEDFANVYIPTILDDASARYSIKIECDECEFQIESLSLKSGNYEMPCMQQTYPNRVTYVCNGQNAPADDYRLTLVSRTMRRNSSNFDPTMSKGWILKHQPQWLK